MNRLTVRDVMTRDVVTVPPTMLVRDVARLLTGRRISGVPVVDAENHVLGLISELDVIARHGATAADIMSKNVITVSEGMEVEEVVPLFTNAHIRRVPVVTDGRLVGLVSRADLIRPPAVFHFLPGDQNDIDMETDPV